MTSYPNDTHRNNSIPLDDFLDHEISDAAHAERWIHDSGGSVHAAVRPQSRLANGLNVLDKIGRITLYVWGVSEIPGSDGKLVYLAARWRTR